ncbi:MAG: hypothetical protein JNK23_10610 [Opitutaceae bacterium]|nr:hypothetical protein [Opitutaceae bacterium]
MPAWLQITLADLNDARVAELIEALRQEELGAGQTDPMPRRIQTVVDEIRRCIGFCASTPLDADTAAIPAGLKDLAVEKIVRGLKGRLLLPLTDDEKDAEKLYQKRLEQLTRCEWPVDAPATPIDVSPVSPTTGAEVARTSDRAATRESLAGL